VPEEPLRLAGLLHDCCREMEPPEALALARSWSLPLRRIDLQYPVLIHGRLAAETARREFGIDDGAVLNAVRYHTAGHPEMSLSDRIFFLCDHMEPNRTGEHLAELRELAFEDLEAAMRMSVDLSISYLHATGKMVDPDTWILRESLHGGA
jgi:predicted HD superfamily hydrolase involved in NAD metabolism